MPLTKFLASLFLYSSRCTCPACAITCKCPFLVIFFPLWGFEPRISHVRQELYPLAGAPAYAVHLLTLCVLSFALGSEVYPPLPVWASGVTKPFIPAVLPRSMCSVQASPVCRAYYPGVRFIFSSSFPDGFPWFLAPFIRVRLLLREELGLLSGAHWKSRSTWIRRHRHLRAISPAPAWAPPGLLQPLRCARVQLLQAGAQPAAMLPCSLGPGFWPGSPWGWCEGWRDFRRRGGEQTRPCFGGALSSSLATSSPSQLQLSWFHRPCPSFALLDLVRTFRGAGLC